MGAWERPLFPKTKNFYVKEKDTHPCPPFVVTIFAFQDGSYWQWQSDWMLPDTQHLPHISLNHPRDDTDWVAWLCLFWKQFPFPKCILVMSGFFFYTWDLLWLYNSKRNPKHSTKTQESIQSGFLSSFTTNYIWKGKYIESVRLNKLLPELLTCGFHAPFNY